jgi:integrase
VTPEKARKLAKRRTGEVAEDRDPAAERQSAREKTAKAGDNTVDALLDAFVERHVRRNLRSAKEVERIFNRYVRPRIGTKSIYEVRRRDIVDLLDAIEDGSGPVMADRTLAHVRKAFNWQATRDDAFNPPIVRGMARTKPADRARKRVLTDEEITDLWAALGSACLPTPFPPLVKVLLLTGQRREEVAQMVWEELEGEAWDIPKARRKKGDEHTVPLTREVLDLLGPRKKKGFVFTTTGGKRPFSGFSKAKHALDKQIAKVRRETKRVQMPPWVLHDLRRTSRSLLSRAGVPADIGERVVGHAIGGVRGVYDRHTFFEEKKAALERLAGLIAQVLKPDPGSSNVISLAVRK